MAGVSARFRLEFLRNSRDCNLFLRNSTDTFIELGGLALEEFALMRVTGDLRLSGGWLVSL